MRQTRPAIQGVDRCGMVEPMVQAAKRDQSPSGSDVNGCKPRKPNTSEALKSSKNKAKMAVVTTFKQKSYVTGPS